MQENSQYIINLVYLSLADEITVEQKVELNEWLSANTTRQRWYAELQDTHLLENALIQRSDTALATLREKLFAKIKAATINGNEQDTKYASIPSIRASHRVHFLKTAWFRYAASVIVVLACTYLYYQFKDKKDVASTVTASMVEDVLPGSNRAVLTLADGKQIVLDSSADKTLKHMGINNDNSTISYAHTKEVNILNTLATPNGGQYKLRLSDGTMVWLNAGSSITYPTTFSGPERLVKVTGEVYFEVAADKHRPFKLEVDNSKIEVLGTSFNINAYNDDGAIKTTLLNGSIKVTKDLNEKILKPGEQAIVSNNIKINNSVNIEQVMAWKNGLFNFENKSLGEVMKELERWYDIKVVYEAGVPGIEFGGNIGRDLSLTQVLKILQRSEVNFTLTNNKTLIVKP